MRSISLMILNVRACRKKQSDVGVQVPGEPGAHEYDWQVSRCVEDAFRRPAHVTR